VEKVNTWSRTRGSVAPSLVPAFNDLRM
jgi:hypothetical protein